MEKSKIKLIKGLGTKRGRSDAGLFIVEGVKMVEELIASDFTVCEIFYTERCDISKITLDSGCVVQQIAPSQMERVSQLSTPSSILALVKLPQRKGAPLRKGELYMALDGVQDPGNMGTIIRICDWYGIRTIYASHESADIFNPKVVQATMGAITRVQVVYCDLLELLSQASQQGITTYTTALDGGNIYDTELSKDGVIIMGNEGHGVSEAVQKASSAKLYLPSYPADNICESLNVGVATAITVAEFRRRL